MKLTPKTLLLVVLGLGFIAWAAPGTIGAIDYSTRWLKAGVALGPTAAVATADKNRLASTVSADIDWDFANTTIVCNDSANHTVTGAKVGMPCFVGVGPRDGGSIVAVANSTFQARVTAADTVVLRHCPAGTAINPDDAGFVVTCIGNQ